MGVLMTWLALAATGAEAADDITAPDGRREYRGQGLVMSVTARTPAQQFAFYSARGFPEDAVRRIAQRCFLTVGIRNGRSDIVWLELDEWRFIDDQNREHKSTRRDEWNALWRRINLPPAYRATFGWTQLPERRDLHPGESAGGNVTLAPPPAVFALEARFRTGGDGHGSLLQVRFDNLSCPRGDTL
ncbi:MAG: hypothetical protein A2150_06475 [Candidatus Muproteobacteria bacterium RBG_16_64_11]|uniref:Uncharacterized protein n=1 Tax=Candidatus Muproteobacteria bacterium RBG_16_64_11 TaxID=1817758 RepID=A0A1F6TB03_9PROT|nr:MAG: hypothetical protein A2150_06475 [Candidatus Muproteobacteria bacterium RBG_16_64_11]